MLSALGYLMEIAGAALLVTAAYLVALPLALAVAGVCLIVVAQAARR